MTATGTDKAPKAAPRMIQAIRSAILDDVPTRLGVDAFTLLVVLSDAQDRLFDRPVKWWTTQLCRVCSFPSKNPHRLRIARNALKGDSWIAFDVPANGQRAQVTYTVLPKTPGKAESDPHEICRAKQLTPTQDCMGEEPTPTKTCAPPLQKRAPDPHRFCTHSTSSISTSISSTSQTKEDPLNPPEGEMGESEDSFELSSSEKSTKTKTRKAKTSKLDDIAAIPIPETLATVEFLEAWQNWQLFRRQKKKPLTEIGARMQLREFDKWGVDRAIAAINHTILKGWDGLKEPDPPKGQDDLFAGLRAFATNHQPSGPPFMPTAEEASRFYNPSAADGGAAEMRAFRESQNKGIRV